MAVNIQKHVVKGTRGDGPSLLIFGGIHGDEFEPMAAARKLIAGLDAADVSGTVTIVPVANEAAYRNKWRTADDGLDLARTFPGRAEGTVTERTAHALTKLIEAADYFIDMHTGGSHLSIYPLAGYQLHDDEDVRDEQRAMAKAFNLPLVWGTSPRLHGRSLSVARDADIPAIYVEHGGAATCNAQGVHAYHTGCLNVMAQLDMIDRDAPPNAVQFTIEDATENSGHLQMHNPAPRGGYFEPAVRLGDRVSAGQPLGTLSDELGEKIETIKSPVTGLVITLRTFPRVNEDDSLAVVIEV